MFFCQKFFSLGLEMVEDNSKHDLVGMADEADDTRVLTLLEVAFLWQKYDERMYPLLRPSLRLPDLLTYRCQNCCCCLASILK